VALRVAAQPWEKRGVDALAAVAEGFWVGLDTPFDLDTWEARMVAETARAAGARVAAHVSEDEALARMGDMYAALERGIDVFIHVTNAAVGEVLEAARRGVGIVYCPAANLYFTGKAPNAATIITLYDEGAEVALGSDNSAWPPPGTAWLLATSYTLYRNTVPPSWRQVLGEALLYAATLGCAKMARAKPGWMIRRVPLASYTASLPLALVKRLHMSEELGIVEPARLE
jgi:cytosine/adenosine deaminase-related metal-dependent hydrolase